jgi:hypothetical protein
LSSEGSPQNENRAPGGSGSSLEDNEISFNNSFPQQGEHIIAGSEDSVEDDREHIASSISFLSKVKLFSLRAKDKSLTSMRSSKRKLF